MSGLDYSKQNISNINVYAEVVDHNFITTDPSILKKEIDIKKIQNYITDWENN